MMNPGIGTVVIREREMMRIFCLLKIERRILEFRRNGKNAYIGKGSIHLETCLRRGNDFLILNMRLLATTTITTEGGY